MPSRRQPVPDRPTAAAQPGRPAGWVPAAGGPAAGPQCWPGPVHRTCFPELTAAPVAMWPRLLRPRSTAGRRKGWAPDPEHSAPLSTTYRPDTFWTSRAACSHALCLATWARSCCHRSCTASAHSWGSGRVRGPRALRSRPLLSISAHTTWWLRSSPSRAWRSAER